MPMVQANGIDVYYETAGSPSAPPVLLIQGLTGYTKGWFAQIPELARDFYVISFDNRGAGKSTPSAPGYVMRDFADDSAALLDALEIARAYVFGISMGGMIGLNLALHYPEKIEKLALGCTTAGGPALTAMDEKVLSAMIAPSTGDGRQDFYRDLWFLIGPEAQKECPQIIEQLADAAAENPQTEIGFMGQLQASATHNVVDALPDLQMPVLVLHGDVDAMFPISNAHHLADNIPNAELEIYPNAGHLFYAEQAEAVNQRLRSFFCS